MSATHLQLVNRTRISAGLISNWVVGGSCSPLIMRWLREIMTKATPETWDCGRGRRGLVSRNWLVEWSYPSCSVWTTAGGAVPGPVPDPQASIVTSVQTLHPWLTWSISPRLRRPPSPAAPLASRLGASNAQRKFTLLSRGDTLLVTRRF